tara:strand:- start:1293 stop:1484 length:192 start_codon:yes stop_codon:yes gene_type:complete
MFYLDGIADKEVTGIERQPGQIIVTFEDDTSHTFLPDEWAILMSEAQDLLDKAKTVEPLSYLK